MSLTKDLAPSGDTRCCAATSIRRTLEAFNLFPPKPKQSDYNETGAQRIVDPVIATTELTASGFPARWRLPEAERGTYLYLGYGSNLCYEVFQQRRGVKPLAMANVVVPTLRLTFDLPGLPYSEPCFANTARRDPAHPTREDILSEKSPLLQRSDYHKDRWKKGLVGVVYEVSKEDYAHIIATEGGGASYHDILVDCYVIPRGENVPEEPKSESFKTHTLFAPPPPTSGDSGDDGQGRLHRPDPSYAQASARYLKFFIDGSNEHDFPEDYKEYLRGLRPYTITTKKQQLGQVFLMTTWGPLFAVIFGLQVLFQDKKGRNPAWLNKMMETLFLVLWASYDQAFKKVYGDGERTIDDNDPNQDVARTWWRPSLTRKLCRTDEESDLKYTSN